MQGGMWIPGDFLVNPRKLTTVLAKEAQAQGFFALYCIYFHYFHINACNLFKLFKHLEMY